MLKRRLIPVLNILNGLIVRSEDFKVHQKIGNIIDQTKRYNDWEVDELIYLDISRVFTYDLGRDDHQTKSYSKIEDIIQRISQVCSMPLTFGGGIRSISDVDLRISNGADKVVINTAAIENPGFISEIAKKYGSQAVISSIDYKVIDGIPMVYSHFGQTETKKDLLTWARECQERGIGEIFINNIDRDGKACGYDINTICDITENIKRPIIACGGAGDFDDLVEVFEETNISAVAAGNIFHFTERAYPRAKKELKNEGINVR